MRVCALLLPLLIAVLNGCQSLTQEQVAMLLKEKSAEIGSQDARIFELKFEAAEKLVQNCTDKACIRDALDLLN